MPPVVRLFCASTGTRPTQILFFGRPFFTTRNHCGLRENAWDNFLDLLQRTAAANRAHDSAVLVNEALFQFIWRFRLCFRLPKPCYTALIGPVLTRGRKNN